MIGLEEISESVVPIVFNGDSGAPWAGLKNHHHYRMLQDIPRAHEGRTAADTRGREAPRNTTAGLYCHMYLCGLNTYTVKGNLRFRVSVVLTTLTNDIHVHSFFFFFSSLEHLRRLAKIGTWYTSKSKAKLTWDRKCFSFYL